MRRPAFRLLLVAAVAAGGAVVTAAPASAYCDPVYEALTERCENGCTLTLDAYARADARTGGALPEHGLVCPA